MRGGYCGLRVVLRSIGRACAMQHTAQPAGLRPPPSPPPSNPPSFFLPCSQVPSLPPFGDFAQVPEGLWLRDDLVLLQVRRPGVGWGVGQRACVGVWVSEWGERVVVGGGTLKWLRIMVFGKLLLSRRIARICRLMQPRGRTITVRHCTHPR